MRLHFFARPPWRLRLPFNSLDVGASRWQLRIDPTLISRTFERCPNASYLRFRSKATAQCRRIALLGFAASPGSDRIAISILALDLDRHGDSVFEVSWGIRGTGPGIAESFHARQTVPSTQSDIAALVASMSRALAMVAKDITVSLGSVAFP